MLNGFLLPVKQSNADTASFGYYKIKTKSLFYLLPQKTRLKRDSNRMPSTKICFITITVESENKAAILEVGQRLNY